MTTADGYFYLASAYTHADEEIRRHRYLQVVDASAECWKRGIFVYSPIVATHDAGRRHTLPWEFEFWNDFNQVMIRRSCGFLLLQNDGWAQSRGLKAEMQFCRLEKIPMFVLGADYSMERLQ